MDSCSCVEDLIVKTRKPYTITKQRERWTVEEHNRFLEALKLYGRAWQRIEEHIGTKTAVQIRSHAQKFFSKLEKEALVKGVPVAQALDIDIPPPRPKRKPSYPYPRKTSTTTPTSQVGAEGEKLLSSDSSSLCKQILDLEKEPAAERYGEEENTLHTKHNQDENCSSFTPLQEAPSSSVCSEKKGSVTLPPVALRNVYTVKEFVPSTRKSNQDEINNTYVHAEMNPNQNWEKSESEQMTEQINGRSKGSKSEYYQLSPKKLIQAEKTDDMMCELSTDEIQTTQNYPRYVPIHVLDGSSGTCNQAPSSNMTFQETINHPTGEICPHPNKCANPAASVSTGNQSDASRSPVHQTFSDFRPPFTQIPHNHHNYRSFLPVSSTFSCLLVSMLLQNPTAHAVASFVASFWPHANTSPDSPAPCNQDGISSGQMNSTPSVEAIAAATVAAATAWWAANGLLPLCVPFHSAFTCTPASTSGVPSVNTAQAPLAKKDGENSQNLISKDQLNAECPEAIQAQNSASKSPTPSLLDYEESGGEKPDFGSVTTDLEKASADTEHHDSNKEKSRKQVDRSSCSSNTPSSSEVETDALEKHDKAKEELQEQHTENPGAESNGRRIRSTNNMTDSWKEVSEEGRLAFQALFSREILPQSFSTSNNVDNKEHQDKGMEEEKKKELENEGASLFDLNRKAWGSSSNLPKSEKNTSCTNEDNGDEGLLTISLWHGKLKAGRTGFKPYKRCSVEAKENRTQNTGNHGEEKVPKRLRREGEAST